MQSEAIDLGSERTRLELAELIRTCEGREALLGRAITADELAPLLVDDSAFHQQGRLWRGENGDPAAFAYLRCFHVNGAINADVRFFVQPAFWAGGLEHAVLAWAAERSAEIGHEHHRQTVLLSDCLPVSQWRAAALDAAGFRPRRYFYQMERRLAGPLPDVPLPQGYCIRSLRVPGELMAWVELFNAAYAGQWNYVPTTVALQEQLRADPRYQNDYDLVVVDEAGRIRAFCLGFVLSRDGGPAGWILEIGSDPAQRGRGLGRAALAAALQRFQSAGVAMTRLAVDGDNASGAQRMYAGLGFAPTSSEVLYGLDLA